MRGWRREKDGEDNIHVENDWQPVAASLLRYLRLHVVFTAALYFSIYIQFSRTYTYTFKSKFI